MNRRGEALDTIEIVASLGAILSNIPEFSNYIRRQSAIPWNQNGESPFGKLLKQLTTILTSKDDIELEQAISMIRDKDQKTLIRDLVQEMGRLDTTNESGYVKSFAARLYLLENPITEETVTSSQAAPNQGGGKKGQGHPSSTTTTRRSSKANTSESAQVLYLTELAAEMQETMSTSGGKPGLSRKKAISTIIERLEHRGVISPMTLKKGFAEAMEKIETEDLELLLITMRANSILGEEECKRIVMRVRSVFHTWNKPEKDTDSDFTKTFRKARKATYRKAYHDALFEACDAKLSAHVKRSESVSNGWIALLLGSIFLLAAAFTVAQQLASR
ncbi:MAG: hypothetical protein HGA33_01470 [Candidatus Moranbacteria bacterium]|nr:hypothetical protein [Candidatus Moranbacteria bacterium]